jgi:hypothetical protein
VLDIEPPVSVEREVSITDAGRAWASDGCPVTARKMANLTVAAAPLTRRCLMLVSSLSP